MSGSSIDKHYTTYQQGIERGIKIGLDAALAALQEKDDTLAKAIMLIDEKESEFSNLLEYAAMEYEEEFGLGWSTLSKVEQTESIERFYAVFKAYKK